MSGEIVVRSREIGEHRICQGRMQPNCTNSCRRKHRYSASCRMDCSTFIGLVRRKPASVDSMFYEKFNFTCKSVQSFAPPYIFGDYILQQNPAAKPSSLCIKSEAGRTKRKSPWLPRGFFSIAGGDGGIQDR